MTLAKLKPTYDDAPVAMRAAPISSDAERIVGDMSPARLLQRRLELGAATMALPEPQRWPIGRSIALVVAVSVALWAAILEAAAQMMHAVA